MLHHLLKNYAEKDNLYIQGNASLRDLVKLMHINKKGVVVVLKDKSPIGILTERDIIEILYKNIKLDEKADKYSRKRLIATNENRTLSYAIHLMVDNKIRRMLVTDDSNNFVGIVTQQDLLKHLQEDFYRSTIKVKHILKNRGYLKGVSRDETLYDVLKILKENKISSVAVTENEEAVGIITEKDIIELVSENVSLENKIDKYMSSPLITAGLDTSLVDVVGIMNQKKIRRIVIVDHEGLAVGIVTIRDVIESLEGDYSKILERKLNNAKEILNIFPEMLIEVIDIGEEQLIIWVNEKVLSVFGCEIIDKPVTDLIPRENWDKIYTTFKKLSKIENIKFRKNNKIFELSGVFMGSYGSAEDGRFQIIIRDVTENVILSTLDSLTNVYNRRVTNEFLMKEIKRSKRYDKCFSICICDIDDFKRINDTYGHLSGDEIIKSLSQLIKSTIRDVDIVGRYGGDEFVIILPDCTTESACNVIERLRLKIENTEISLLNGIKEKITVSFGISTYPEDGMSSDDLLITSDERLYKAKEFGKNKVASNLDRCP